MCELEWGPIYRWFGVMNSVKQGGVLSPVFFCIYLEAISVIVYYIVTFYRLRLLIDIAISDV